MSARAGSRTAVRLVIPSEVRLVDLVHAASEQMGRFAGLDTEQSLNLAIAVREAVINAIQHGNGGDPGREVDITLQVNGRGIRASVVDQGSGFDPEGAPDPTAEENLLAPGGRGLLMIRAYVDEVDFRFHRGRGMEVTLVKRAPARAT